jgi:hypothetical protein
MLHLAIVIYRLGTRIRRYIWNGFTKAAAAFKGQ